ncbi:Mesocentin [Hoyosella altamirensis]|uniref:Lipoprotein n=1 Tax=Hoyosella altamirensis TaxID=616997 RepID=A0A839RT53_9ACTN|nr:Mesocentin [Hoyosella altamirensis]MBB3039366.1 hypothetical protein [Hoyosella altamirensis]
MNRRSAGFVAALALPFLITACGDDATEAADPTPASPAATATTTAAVPESPAAEGSWDSNGQPVNGGPPGADGSTGNNLTRDHCAHNQDPACPEGSYLGPHVVVNTSHGHWGHDGQPVDGGPTGADGSTGNSLTQEYCAQNEDPGCPMGSYVGPDAIPDPDGSPHYVQCEGTVCTNPNHGAGGQGYWDPDGEPVFGGPNGADGSSDNSLTQEYCAQNEDPGCPMGSYVGPDAMASPDGAPYYVPCEGTICTNPDHGAGEDPGQVDGNGDGN